jgi:hypothetical protein
VNIWGRGAGQTLAKQALLFVNKKKQKNFGCRGMGVVRANAHGRLFFPIARFTKLSPIATSPAQASLPALL